MKVILLERVGRYGSIGDEVSVKNGYARNFLLPQGKALRATKRNEERKESAAGIATGLNGHSVVMIRQAGETGQLYGSVSSRDISEALIADGFSVQRSQVDLASPIKTVGMHEIPLNLHAEVSVHVNINVARSEDEAERQATGEDMTRVSYDDEAEDVAAGQDVFDDEDKVIEDDDAEEAEADAEASDDEEEAVTAADEEEPKAEA
jgi:large subunit ribosomal protein L9